MPADVDANAPSRADELRGNLTRKLDSLGFDASKDFDRARQAFNPGRKLSDEELWRALNGKAGSVFSEVFQFELDALADGVPDATRPVSLAEVNQRAHQQKLAGLAFSGGGIRSATFNLGVLQALAEMRLLRDFDYLSTVSGGGYIGGWLSKWIKEKGGSVEAVEEELVAANDKRRPRSEPAPVQFLRQYSNYLTPKTGLFSADTWTLICTYARNTLLNLTMLVAWLAALFLLPRMVVSGVRSEMATPTAEAWPYAAALFLAAVAFIALSISRKGPKVGAGWLGQTQGKILLYICLPLMLSGFLGSLAVWEKRAELVRFWDATPDSLSAYPYHWLLLPGAVYFLAWSLGWGAAQLLNRRDDRAAAVATPAPRHDPPRKMLMEGLGHLLCALGALAVGTLLLLKGLSLASHSSFASFDAVQLACLGMPLMLGLFAVTITLMIGLIGRMYLDQSREWWARQGAWTFIFAIAWLALFVCTFYLPPLLDWAFQHYAASTTLGAALTSAVTFFGLKSGSDKATGKAGAGTRLDLVAQVAPYAFSLLAIAALTTGLQYVVAEQPVLKLAKSGLVAYFDSYLAASSKVGIVAVGALFLKLLAVALILGWRVDINKFSLYMMYRMRLVRAYFGASSPSRCPHPFTGFDPNDDPPLESLLRQSGAAPMPGAPGAAATAPAGSAPGAAPARAKLQRPYHLISAAINLVNGKELAWQTRKAANFCFTPAFCGFEMPAMRGADRAAVCPQRGAFRPTASYAATSTILKDDDTVVKLGTAVAVSGAAASPNMGYHSSPPLTFLMTLFNLRLGRWSPNPMKEKSWQQSSPPIGLFCILSELFGMTDAEADFLYLSDGGHFENLALYELVRRRCKLIVVVDAGCDDKQNFEDLGNAIRKCATDLNVAITLDARKIRKVGDGDTFGASCVSGRVHYKQADGKASDGVLLYIKPTIVGDENADIFNYSKTHPEFPHQSTADQWFDEDQFESYRSLGYQIALGALRQVAAKSAHPRWQGARRKWRISYICRLLSQPAPVPRSGNVVPLSDRRVERRRASDG
ncbi:patatin-like phospholipase family protein [Rugamonas rubra]|uniref:Patatin-like phospholipase n=1 Tax=Rugamonas rubra TaxID=758825 RepID=A0A1I4PKV0_9BURK|nr:patatin-like phospholipase family protein [Rugamonas rubra]SFM28378.1 Patatin-like phospholipase [Rugamonas rubra]